MRTYQACLKSHLDFLVTPFDSDVFISTWNLLGFSSVKWKPYPRFEGAVTEDELKQAYGDCVKGIKVEDPASVTTKLNRAEELNTHSNLPNHKYPAYRSKDRHLTPRIVSMWYKIQSAYQLMKAYADKHAITYDFIIKIRPDVRFTTPLPPLELQDKTLYLTSTNVFRGWNDQVAFGNAAVMRVYCDTLSHFDQYVAENQRIPEWAEGVVQRHMGGHRIRRQIVPTQYVLERRPVKHIHRGRS